MFVYRFFMSNEAIFVSSVIFIYFSLLASSSEFPCSITDCVLNKCTVGCYSKILVDDVLFFIALLAVLCHDFGGGGVPVDSSEQSLRETLQLCPSPYTWSTPGHISNYSGY